MEAEKLIQELEKLRAKNYINLCKWLVKNHKDVWHEYLRTSEK